MKLPSNIEKLLEGKDYKLDSIGKSDSQVMIFDDSVLKIVKYSSDNEEKIQVLRWAEGKLPVPKVIAFEEDEDFQYLLMSKVPGGMSCDDYYMSHPDKLMPLLAEATKMVHSVDISGCQRDCGLDALLKEAHFRVENNLVDTSDAEPETYGEDGFKNPEELLIWLENNRPEYEPTLVHGDFCLPNIFFDKDRVSGFIDIGGMGVGDKWQDIALCYRSLAHNANGVYGGKVYSGIDSKSYFDFLGIEPDWDKIRYYILLDELF